LRRYCREKVVFVFKVTIGRVVRHLGAARQFPQSEGARTGLGYQRDGGIEQKLLEVSVMIAPLGGHDAIVSNDVDRSNIRG